IDNIDVSFNGPGRSGTGILTGDFFGAAQNLTFLHVTAAARGTGIDLEGGMGMSIQSSTFANNGTGIVASSQGDATLVANSDVVDGDTSSITNLVAAPGADGAISLREAIVAANNTAGADMVPFAIGAGAQTIRLATALPALTEAVTIDGTTQPGFTGSPLITI